jgi:hypothetical protein
MELTKPGLRTIMHALGCAIDTESKKVENLHRENRNIDWPPNTALQTDERRATTAPSK